MRKIKFNAYERVAGIFVLTMITGFLLTIVSGAVKQGWFDPRIRFQTTFESADGVHAGTSVKMAGLQVGSVENVELLEDNRVRVDFYVLGKFRERVRQNSKAMLIRPYVIGDRVLEISVGDEKVADALKDGDEIASEESMDLMSLMSGKRMNEAMARMSLLVDGAQTIIHAFSDQDRVASVIRMFDKMEPLLNRVDTMSGEVIQLSRQATRGEALSQLLSQVTLLSREMNRILPALNQQNPELGQDLAGLLKSLSRMTTEMDQAFQELSQENPGTARRAVEALNQMTVLVKALQKNMFIRGSVREVLAEEKSQQDPPRLPASKNPKKTDAP